MREVSTWDPAKACDRLHVAVQGVKFLHMCGDLACVGTTAGSVSLWIISTVRPSIKVLPH